jgi:hypothetical protein
VALQRRQALSDIGHYQYYDNQTRAIAHTGRILLSLIPFYYDTPRMQRIIGEDGVPSMEPINQSQPSPADAAVMQVKNDLKVGRYDVVMDTGPGYETKRLEGANSMLELLKTELAKPITAVGADLVVRSMDFAGADDLANRLMPTNPAGMQKAIAALPKQAQGIVQAIQQQSTQKDQVIQQLQSQLKFKTDIEQGWMAVERDKINANLKTALDQDKTKQMDAHLHATTARDVAEIYTAGQLLDTHVEAAHESVARRETLEAAKKAEAKTN